MLRDKLLLSRDQSRLLQDLHVLCLFCLGVAHPLLDVLAGNAQFFIVRRNPPQDLYSVAIVFSLLAPGFLILVRHLLDLGARRLGVVFHSLLIWILFALLLLFMQRKLMPIPAPASMGTAVVLASLALYSYWRHHVTRLFLAYLFPAVMVVPFLFLSSSAISRILSADTPVLPRVEVSSKTPVIILALDELPLGSLLNDQMQIDAVCFPNFARLQRQSTWYRNVSAVSDLTDHAIAAVVTGVYPDVPRLTTTFDYPQNLFTLLGASYQLRVGEADTQFHPDKTIFQSAKPETYAERMHSLFLDLSAVYLQVVLPGEYAKAFPTLGQTWRDFWQQDSRKDVSDKGRKSRDMPFLEFIRSLKALGRPVLYFLHVELPHGPWLYLPSGTEYNYGRWKSPLAKEETLQGWGGEESVAYRAFQRYMLQLSYTDHLLGQLLDRLDAQGLYESSLLIVVADHGMCFDPKESHRPVTSSNFVDILSVPLFVKMPLQNEGIIDDRNAETVDVLPTIADVLGVDPGWKFDGESLLRPSTRTTRRAFGWMNSGGKPFEFPLFSYKDSKALQLKLALFGSQVSTEDLLRFGPVPGLYGTPLSSLSSEGADELTLKLYNRKSIQNVDLVQRFVPALVSGEIHFRKEAPGKSIVIVALNGIVRGSARSFRIGKNKEGFALMVPESSFRQGRNEVVVLLSEQGRYLRPNTGWID